MEYYDKIREYGKYDKQLAEKSYKRLSKIAPRILRKREYELWKETNVPNMPLLTIKFFIDCLNKYYVSEKRINRNTYVTRIKMISNAVKIPVWELSQIFDIHEVI